MGRTDMCNVTQIFGAIFQAMLISLKSTEKAKLDNKKTTDFEGKKSKSAALMRHWSKKSA
jgi:hypothetical protein